MSKKKRFYNEGYFRVPMQNLIKPFNPKIANKLNNPIYLLLAYIIVFLIGVLLWGIIGLIVFIFI